MNKFFIKRKGGFTLIELLVVIAIIGILASIVVVSMGGARSQARDAKRQSDIRQMSGAQEMYYSTKEGYAPIVVDANSRLTTTAISTYLDPLPIDPGGGKVANCNTSPAGAYKGFGSADLATEYCVYTCLENTKFFAASEKGTRVMDAAPTALSCW